MSTNIKNNKLIKTNVYIEKFEGKQLPFGRGKKKKGKNPFEASLHIDESDVKVVTASYKDEPFFIGIGVSSQRKTKGSGQVDLVKGAKGEYQSEKELDWRLLYNPNALPSGFIPLEKVKNLMAGTVAATSGSTAVFNANTQYDQSAPKTITDTQHALNQGKLTSFQLIDFIQKRIEIEHKTPLSEGGTNDVENLRVVEAAKNRRDKTVIRKNKKSIKKDKIRNQE